jgi:hypothetical protein
MLSPAEFLESAAIGILLSILGTYLLSRRKGAEVLDTERARDLAKISAELEETATQNIALRAAASRKDPVDEFKEQEVRGWLESFPAEEIKVIRWLLHHGESDDDDFRALLVSVAIRGAALNKAIRHGLVKTFPRGTGTAHKISEGYRDALREVLHPRTVTQ